MDPGLIFPRVMQAQTCYVRCIKAEIRAHNYSSLTRTLRDLNFFCVVFVSSVSVFACRKVILVSVKCCFAVNMQVSNALNTLAEGFQSVILAEIYFFSLILAFLRKVYSILSVQVLLTTVTSAIFLYSTGVQAFVHER